MRSPFSDAWQLRTDMTFADAICMALAAHLGADLLTGDHKLASAPNLPVAGANR